MILETEKFEKLAPSSTETILCRCDRCLIEVRIQRKTFNNKKTTNYKLCKLCFNSDQGKASKDKKRKSNKLIEQRLKSKIEILPNGCWQWTGSIQKRPLGSYGEIIMGGRINKKHRRAHVVSYETFIGPIVPKHEIDHLCHNTLCINPDHLEQVTHQVNMQRTKRSPAYKQSHQTSLNA